MIRNLFLSIAWMCITSAAFADATIPTSDKKGSKDHPLLKRYEGSFIVGYEYKAFDEFNLPLSELEPQGKNRDSHNNLIFEPKQKKSLEGARTRIVYLLPATRTPLEAIRNYQEEIKAKGGNILYECKAEQCGGSATRSSSGGGGEQSLSMYLYPEERITEPDFSNAACSMKEKIVDQRYIAAEVPGQNAFTSVLAYTLKDDLYCKAFNDRTIVVVDIIEMKAREQKMVTVNADEMAKKLANTGSVALYGIYFDFNKADIKPESTATLEQIAKLLKDHANLKLLVVGHTDNVGTFDFNKGLSQRRAEAVVSALTTTYGIARNRLTPYGVSFAAPVASNKTDDGRAKNRRVELVEM